VFTIRTMAAFITPPLSGPPTFRIFTRYSPHRCASAATTVLPPRAPHLDHTRTASRAPAVMEDSLGKIQKGGKHFGGMTYTRQIPSFIAKMNGGKSNDEGIKGALERRQGQGEREEREDTEEERPVMVESTDAMISKERKVEAAESRKAAASKLFKPDDTAARFSDSAHSRHAEWEEQQKRQKRPSEAGAADSAALAAEAGRHSFGAKKKLQKRSKASAAGGLGASKAVRNPGLLSFDEDDE
jgi:hypothetical protein